MADSDIIRLLPDSVANQIAAGEVIQRPASVVKELVENSVDAGATDITIIIKDAGRTLIQVVDNGSGMSPTDARMSFERHATSKIAVADDLYALHTMGFRGEALASIAAVSQIDLRTMRHGESVGCRLVISASKVESQEPCACAPGTNMMVKNLFAFLPARRKFLKKDSVELSHILHEFERLALINTGIALTLIHNDVTIHSLRAESLKQRICNLFGKALEHQIVPLAADTSIVKLSGFIGLPQFAKHRGANQFLFVNGRNMRHPYFHKAVLSCYDQLISSDSQPSYFINFEVEPSKIDVNIHPQKHEIKFEDEQAIWQIIVAAVRESLGKVNAAGAIDFDTENAPEIPIYSPNPEASVAVNYDPNYNPFATQSHLSDSMGNSSLRSKDWSHNAPAPSLAEVSSMLNMLETTRPVGQQMSLDNMPDIDGDVASKDDSSSVSYICISNRYILTPSREGLLIIDSHRAHVRVLFDRIMGCISTDNAIATQRLIFPEVITLSAAEDVLLSSICDTLASLGFDISPLGNNSWAVNGMPSVIADTSPTATFNDIISQVNDTEDTSAIDLFSSIALSMARSSSINSSNRLSQTEIDTLVSDLFKTSSPKYTPDGLLIIASITSDDLARLLN